MVPRPTRPMRSRCMAQPPESTGILVRVKLTFCGASGTVTGSRYVLEHDVKRVLFDCGLFQGSKEIRQRNWGDPGFDPAALDAIVLTHAHVDHSAYLPRVVAQGFRGHIFAT